jgi:homoserine O-acetyltransferase
MQALEWLTAHPDRLKSAIVIATTAKHSAQQIALNEVGRQAIIADPHWKEGHCYGGHLPAKGLAVARIAGHINYMSETSMGEKFGRRLKNNGKEHKFSIEFEVEDYLHHRGNNSTIISFSLLTSPFGSCFDTLESNVLRCVRDGWDPNR